MFILGDPPPAIDPVLLDTSREAEPATIGHFRQVGLQRLIQRLIIGLSSMVV